MARLIIAWDRRGVLIVSDGAVEAGVNNQSRRRHRGSRHDFRVTACACHTISPDSVVIGRTGIQPGHHSPGNIADIQIVVPLHVSAERTAR